MAGCSPKKFSKGGAVRKPLRMAAGGLVPGAANQAMQAASSAAQSRMSPVPLGPGRPGPGVAVQNGDGPSGTRITSSPQSRPFTVTSSPQSNPFTVTSSTQSSPFTVTSSPQSNPFTVTSSPQSSPFTVTSSQPRGFKKGGMVNAKSSSGSSVRPRGASGRGVKSCKVC